MNELFTTDAWIALLEFISISGIITAGGCYIERKTEGRPRRDNKVR